MERIGEKLRKRREELGFTIDDIARATNFRPEMIKGVEAGRPGIFPAEAYLKAFLRAYASKLGLDPQEIIRVQKSEEERVQEAISGIRVRQGRRVELRGVLVWIGIAAVITVGVLVVYQRVPKVRHIPGERRETSESLRAHREPPVVLAAIDSAETTSAVSPEDMEVTGVAGEVADTGAAVSAAGGVQPGETEDVIPTEAVELEEQDVEEEVGADLPVPAVQPGEGDESDKRNVREDTGHRPDSLFVSVSGWSTDVKLLSGGEIIFEGTLRPGDRRTFYSTEPFLFDYITNKDAISILYNGRPVRLPSSGGKLVPDLRIPREGR